MKGPTLVATTTPHSGRYRLGRLPRLKAPQNVASSSVVSAMLDAYLPANYEGLAVAVRQHRHIAGSYAFIDYCIRHGWLRRA